jgi:phosphatidate cytidylyltransferase
LLVAGHGIVKPGALGAVGGFICIFWPQLSALVPNTLSLLLLFTILVLISALRLSTLGEILPYTGAVSLGALYSFAPWRFSIDLRSQSVHLLFFALALNWAGDSTAFYVGRAFGKHRLAPIISPAKSWEGAIASVAGSAICGILYLGFFLPHILWWQVAIMAIAGNVAGQFGDLVESAIKRGAGVKDSGNLLPGHGGVLDRMDSSLFALPTVYLLYFILHINK